MKPQNVLVYKDEEGRLIAKVADLGYAQNSLGANKVIKLPRSRPWVAPNWHGRGFEFHMAKKMDIFSLGMLCLWTLFGHELLDFLNRQITGAPGLERVSFVTSEGATYARLEGLQKSGKLSEVVLEFLSTATHLPSALRGNLGSFFKKVLCSDFSSHDLDIDDLIRFLDPTIDRR